MKYPVWTKAIKESADPVRAQHFYELLMATSAGPALAKCSAEEARIVVALLSGSKALGNLLVKHPQWLSVLSPESLGYPRRKQGFKKEVAEWLKDLLAAGDYAAALRRVREFKELEMLRIAARDLARLGNQFELKP